MDGKKAAIIMNEQHKLLEGQIAVLQETGFDWNIFGIPAGGLNIKEQEKIALEIGKEFDVVVESPKYEKIETAVETAKATIVGMKFDGVVERGRGQQKKVAATAAQLAKDHADYLPATSEIVVPAALIRLCETDGRIQLTKQVRAARGLS